MATFKTDLSTRTNVQRIATVAGGNVQLAAGRDLTALGAGVTADRDLTEVASGNLTIAAVAGQYQIDVKDRSGMSVQGRTGYITGRDATVLTTSPPVPSRDWERWSASP